MSAFIVTINDGFTIWEYKFTNHKGNLSIQDLAIGVRETTEAKTIERRLIQNFKGEDMSAKSEFELDKVLTDRKEKTT